MSARIGIGPQYWEAQTRLPWAEKDDSDRFRQYNMLLESMMVDESPQVWSSCHTWPGVSVAGILNELEKRGYRALYFVEVPYVTDPEFEDAYRKSLEI